MDLTPVRATGGSNDPDAVQMSAEAIALANIQTTTVGTAHPIKELHLYGTIQPNQRLVKTLSAHVNGRIENLLVNTIGENITIGQVIAQIYSPDLLLAQTELIEASKLSHIHPALLNAAREKLRLLNLSDIQIAEIEESGKASPIIDIKANVEGVVSASKVGVGDYVSTGTVLFDLVDLSSVWAVFNAFEADIPYLQIGNTVEYTLQALPGRSYSGNISAIEPIMDQTTRTVMVRVVTANSRLELKPGMFATAIFNATISETGQQIIIPKTAVLWTGRRSIVYVKVPEEEMPTFKLRDIELGPSLGDDYIVLAGLFPGEEIVTRGGFVIDASAQLEGRVSMMNRGENNITEQATITQSILIVQGLCSMCKETIEAAAKSTPGVQVAIWDSETKQLRLNYNSNLTNLNVIASNIAAVGYDNELFIADDAIYNNLHACCLYRGENTQASGHEIIPSLIETKMMVQGLCSMCKRTIETTTKNMPGVSEAEWDGSTKQLSIKYDSTEIDLDTIAKAIAEKGYDNEFHTGNDEVYSKLPRCCLYR